MAQKRNKLFSEQLREAILSSDMLPSEIARESGVPKEVISRFTHGKTGMSLPSVDAIIAVLNLRLVPEQTTRKKGG
jgi:hypothetical protein